MARTTPNARTKLLDTALNVIRSQGYSATSVDEVCEGAGVTKGAFFHHFKSKEELAVAAAEHFAKMADDLFAAAPYRALKNPVERVLGYVDFRKSILRGELPQFTCLLGTMVQEAYESHPAIRKACAQFMIAHAEMVQADIAEALRANKIDSRFSAESLSYHVQAVIQGAFVLAKATNGAAVAVGCLDHLRNYLEMIFKPARPAAGAP